MLIGGLFACCSYRNHQQTCLTTRSNTRKYSKPARRISWSQPIQISRHSPLRRSKFPPDFHSFLLFFLTRIDDLLFVNNRRWFVNEGIVARKMAHVPTIDKSTTSGMLRKRYTCIERCLKNEQATLLEIFLRSSRRATGNVEDVWSWEA